MSLPIFLVEDEPVLRDQLIALTKIMLDAEIVGMAESENEAVIWLHDHSNAWKIAVIDLYLKEGTGFGILSCLTEHRDRRVIVLTNSANRENRSRCLALGADAVFDKSAELENFINYCADFSAIIENKSF